MSTISNTTSTTTAPTTTNEIYENPDGVLGKDDFMKLLLAELQYQDPTDPVDSDKILTQTSELATLEATDNTNKALEDLAAQLGSSTDLNAISAIGKMGSLGTDSITLTDDSNPTFEIYFNHDVQSGTVTIADSNNNIVRSFDLESLSAGVHSFEWDGTDDSGDRLPEGSYSITADYTDGTTGSYSTAFGIYPIESVRFDEDSALLKMGSNYYPLENIKEIYQ